MQRFCPPGSKFCPFRVRSYAEGDGVEVNKHEVRHKNWVNLPRVTSAINIVTNMNGLLLTYHNTILLKGPIFLKTKYFVIKERFNKLIYGINTIINVASDSLLKFS